MASSVKPGKPTHIVDKIKQQKLREAEVAFMSSLKANRFQDALDQCYNVLALDPNNRVKDFVALLEEKIELDAPTDEDEEDEDGAEDDDAGDEDDDDDDDDDDSEDDDEEDDGDEEMEGEDTISEQVEELAEQLADEIILDPSNIGSSVERKKLQIVLAKSMIGIMQQETKKDVVNDDPLLGA